MFKIVIIQLSVSKIDIVFNQDQIRCCTESHNTNLGSHRSGLEPWIMKHVDP